MFDGMRTLAIDLGAKRVGLAMSDEGAKFATPLEVVTISSAEQAMKHVSKVIQDERVKRIVVGVPLNMDGSMGAGAKAAIAWGKDLATTAGVQAVFVDERLSSFAAEQKLADRKRGGEKLTRGRKKERLDAMAAAGFLQEFLDGKLTALAV